MKKFIYFCLLLAVVVTFSGCSGDDTIYEDEELSGDDGSYAECPELRGIWEFVSANLKYSHTSTLSNPVVEGTLVFTNDLKVIRNLKYSDGSKVKDTYKCNTL